MVGSLAANELQCGTVTYKTATSYSSSTNVESSIQKVYCTDHRLKCKNRAACKDDLWQQIFDCWLPQSIHDTQIFQTMGNIKSAWPNTGGYWHLNQPVLKNNM